MIASTTTHLPPVALTRLRHPVTGAIVEDVPMLLDTGADATFIPRQAIEDLGVTSLAGKVYEISSFDGTTSSAPVVRVDILFAGRTFRGQYLVVNAELGFIGRNILNLVNLELDGPSQTWDIRTGSQ